jgi:hypothetical protein
MASMSFAHSVSTGHFYRPTFNAWIIPAAVTAGGTLSSTPEISPHVFLASLFFGVLFATMLVRILKSLNSWLPICKLTLLNGQTGSGDFSHQFSPQGWT